MALHYHKILRTVAIISDLLTVILAYLFAVELRNYILFEKLSIVGHFEFSKLFLHIMIIWWLLLIFMDTANPKRYESLKGELRIGFITTLVGTIIMLSFGFLTKYYFPRSVLASFVLVYTALFTLQKVVGYYVMLKMGKAKKIPILIVGTEDRAVEFCKDMRREKGIGHQIVGFLDFNEENIGQRLTGNHCIIGSFNQLDEILKTYNIDEVFFVLSPKYFEFIEPLMGVCSEAGVTNHLIYNPGRLNHSRASVDSVAGYPVITYSRIPEDELALFVKRIMDIVISGLFLVVISPLFLILAAALKKTSEGPVFYPNRVVGKNNREFTSYKFRTMVENADAVKESLMDQNEMSGPVFKLRNDPRITPIGKWLRKFSIDELPQFWSVLKGDMSLVGPRPPGKHELDRFDFWQRRKISIKPGITCLWQVSGRNEISDFTDWCNLDLEYIDNWSLWLDLKILAKTAWVVLKGTGR